MSSYSQPPWRIQAGEIADANGHFVASCDGECPTERDEENLALISAAPELLAACKAALRFGMPGTDSEGNDVSEIINTAIAKATRKNRK